jgi:capsular polysaccharide biosynthesis protein
VGNKGTGAPRQVEPPRGTATPPTPPRRQPIGTTEDPRPSLTGPRNRALQWFSRISRRRRPSLVGLTAGLVAALLVATIGLLVASTRPTTWTAQSQMLLAPSLQGRPSQTSDYYATLSAGQLPATAAAIVQERRFLIDTVRELGLSDPTSVTAKVTVVPETAILEIKVTASNPDTAVAVADELAAQAAPTVNQLLTPYFVTTLGSAEGTASQSSIGKGQWAALILFGAAVAGVAVQQLAKGLEQARVRRNDSDER